MIAGTLVWVTNTYQRFAIDSQNQLTAATVSHLVTKHIEERHQQKVHPFIDEWSRLSTLVEGMKAGDPDRARIAANRMVHTLEVAQGRVQLRNVVVYTKDLERLASSEKGSTETIASLPALLDGLRQRSVRESRRIESYSWRSAAGRPLNSTIAPVGGFQVAGFIEFVTDPISDLQGLDAALQGQFSLVDVNGKTVFGQPPMFTRADRVEDMETLRVPIRGAMGEVWAVATLTRDLSDFNASIGALRDQALAIVAAVVLGSVMIGWLLLRLAVFGRLKEFSKAMQMLASGDTKVDVPNVGPDELNTIRNALLSLRDAVRERRDANAKVESARMEAEKQARLQRIILDNVGQGIIVFQNENLPILANELAEKFTGLAPHLALAQRETAEAGTGGVDAQAKAKIRTFNERIRSGEQGFVTTYERHGNQPGSWTQVSLRSLDDGMIVQTYQDITNLRAAIETARQAQFVAEKANQAKTDFLSNMSHELRTPLNAIIGFTEFVLVNEKETVTESQRDSLSQVLKAGRHLLNLIDDILDLAKIEADSVALTIEPVEPCAVIDECIALTASLGATRNVGVWNRINDTSLPPIAVDRTRFKQVLLNLISNGIKYNKRGGSVRIEQSMPGDRMLRLGVRDDGPGIPATQIESLFDPFDRLGAENSAIEGTGIGLTITKRLVDQMGGRIEVESTVGAGTTFWLEFPLSDRSRNSTGRRNDNKDHLIGARQDHATVLCIDDDPAHLDLVRKMLGQRRALAMVDAPTGELGLERARSERPGVIMVDVDLPGIDSYDLLETLRAMPETENTPVIALAAAATEAERRKGEEAGFFKYLVKPVATAEMIQTVDMALDAGQAGPDFGNAASAGR